MILSAPPLSGASPLSPRWNRLPRRRPRQDWSQAPQVFCRAGSTSDDTRPRKPARRIAIGLIGKILCGVHGDCLALHRKSAEGTNVNEPHDLAHWHRCYPFTPGRMLLWHANQCEHTCGQHAAFLGRTSHDQSSTASSTSSALGVTATGVAKRLQAVVPSVRKVVTNRKPRPPTTSDVPRGPSG